MAFPERNWFRQPKGWSDLGGVGDTMRLEGDYKIKEYLSHDLCKTRASVGKEGGECFTFCPRCDVKLKPA